MVNQYNKLKINIIYNCPMSDFSKLAKKWDLYTYPWRPSDKNINVFENIISKNMHVCILWATKEIREMCKKVWCRVSVFDISEEMLHSLSVWNNKETKYCSNWLDISWFKFDLILWDFILFLLTKTQQEDLIKVVNSNLKPWWKFLIRDITSIQNLSPELLEKYNHIHLWEKELVNLYMLEYICMNGWNSLWILKYTKTHNPIIYKKIKKDYIDIIPFSQTKRQSNTIHSNFNILQKKRFLFFEEQILEYIKS